MGRTELRKMQIDSKIFDGDRLLSLANSKALLSCKMKLCSYHFDNPALQYGPSTTSTLSISSFFAKSSGSYCRIHSLEAVAVNSTLGKASGKPKWLTKWKKSSGPSYQAQEQIVVTLPFRPPKLNLKPPAVAIKSKTWRNNIFYKLSTIILKPKVQSPSIFYDCTVIQGYGFSSKNITYCDVQGCVRPAELKLNWARTNT